MVKTHKTPGDIWSEKAEKENPVAAFLVFMSGMVAVTLLLAAFTAVPQAEGEYQAAKVSTSHKKSPEKAKVKSFKRAVKQYRQWNDNMTKKQREDYRNLAWKMLDCRKKAKLKKLESKCSKLIARAKLCQHIEARGYSDKKVAFVCKWGPRINAYLHGSPMAGSGYSTAKSAFNTGVDPRLYVAICCVESNKGRITCGHCNAAGWICGAPSMHSWADAADKWHSYFKRYFKNDWYPVSSMHGYGGYGPEIVNAEMAKI